MGGATAAAAQGAESLFQNPAALARLEPESRQEAALGYDALLATAYQGAAAWATPLGRDSALGAGFVYASQAPQAAYDANGNATGSFTPLDLAAGAGGARRVGPVALGLGLKAVRSSLPGASGTTFAADLGLLARHATDLGEGPLDVGASVANLGPPIKLGQSSDPLPLRARAGAVWHPAPNLDAALDAVFPVDADAYAAVGFEARLPASMLGSSRPWTAALRAGYDENRGRGVDGFSGASFGAGLDLGSLRLDFAWLFLGALGSANRTTLAFRF